MPRRRIFNNDTDNEELWTGSKLKKQMKLAFNIIFDEKFNSIMAIDKLIKTTREMLYRGLDIEYAIGVVFYTTLTSLIELRAMMINSDLRMEYIIKEWAKNRLEIMFCKTYIRENN